MRIAMIGTGNVGAALGKGWAGTGHEVIYGARDPDGERARAAAGAAGARLTTVGEAAAGGDVVVLAVPWAAVDPALETAGDLRDKPLLDCTNPLLPDLSGLALGHATSGGEHVASAATGGRVVKIFNTTGSGNMEDPAYGDLPVTMLYAGDDPEANGIAAGLARDLGFEPVELGPLATARLLEPFALVWITLALGRGHGTDIALNVVRR